MLYKRQGRHDGKSSNVTEDYNSEHINAALTCSVFQKQAIVPVLKYIKVSLQDLFIASALPFIISFAISE